MALHLIAISLSSIAPGELYRYGKNERNKEIWILRCLVWIKADLLSLPLMNLRKRNNIGYPVERLIA